MTHSTIAGTGGYLPERVMTNKEFEKIVDTSDEWIRERTGIKRRHIAADGETTSDMALAAARNAMEAAAAGDDEIDLIIVATTIASRRPQAARYSVSNWPPPTSMASLLTKSPPYPRDRMPRTNWMKTRWSGNSS